MHTRKTECRYSSSKKTHEKIKKAFAELLSEKKALNKITVADLTKRAEITRGTFYAHFSNIYEVAESIENEFMSALDFQESSIDTEKDFSSHLHQVFEFLAANEEIYRLLLSSDAPMPFVRQLNKRMGKTIRKSLKERKIDRPMIDLDIAFFTDGATYMLVKYFRGDINLSLDDIEWYLKQRIIEMVPQELLFTETA